MGCNENLFLDDPVIPCGDMNVPQFIARPQETDMPVSESIVTASAVLILTPESIYLRVIPMPMPQIGHITDSTGKVALIVRNSSQGLTEE